MPMPTAVVMKMTTEIKFMRKSLFSLILVAGLFLASIFPAYSQDVLNLETFTCEELMVEVQADEQGSGMLLLLILAYFRGQNNDPVIPLDENAGWEEFAETVGAICTDPAMKHYTVVQMLRELARR